MNILKKLLSGGKLRGKCYFAHRTAVIDRGVVIENGCKIWHFSHIMRGSHLKENCNIGQNVVISSNVVLGKGCKVQNNVSVYTGVKCGDNVFLGPSCVFTNVINPRSAVNRKDEYKETILGDGVSIGANATIVCGVNIGDYAFVGAGAVVTKDISPYSLVVGNPAKQIGWISRAGARLEFDAFGKAICPLTGESYSIKDGVVTLL